MESIGAEVGQKMRSAIKAKLLELNCYVDEELPDYIMVMVANRRSKSQMAEDLNLFLSAKTSAFVDWLHIVLKKLKEVTVTNPEIYKKVSKRKSSSSPDMKVKKEKKSKKSPDSVKAEEDYKKSLTDNLPISANTLSEQRKIMLTSDDDTFDIPLLSEVKNSSREDLDEIEKKIKNVKSRLGLLVESDGEYDSSNLKTEIDESSRDVSSFSTTRIVEIQNDDNDTFHSTAEVTEENSTGGHTPPPEDTPESEPHTPPSNTDRRKRTPITFQPEEPKKKPSILDRLGKRITDTKRSRVSLSEFRKEEERFLGYSKSRERDREDRDRREDSGNRRGKSRRDRSRSPERSRDHDGFRTNRSDTRRNESKAVLSRLGVMSTVHVPPKQPEEQETEDELKTREVRSVVQVKPRIIPADTPQANKTLLLKAVAEAHKSIAQAPKVGSMKSNDSPKRAKYRLEDKPEEYASTRKLSQGEKTKLRNLILAQVLQDRDGDDLGDLYVPRPLRKSPKEPPKYVPSSRHEEDEYEEEEEEAENMTGGIEEGGTPPRISAKLRLQGKGETVPRISAKLRLQEIDKTPPRISAKLRLQGRDETPPRISAKLRLQSEDGAPPRKSAKLRLQAEREGLPRKSARERIQARKSPSPIIFDNLTTKVSTKVNVPDKLPVVRPPLSIKNKERCKYWPLCRQGDKCEFAHPSTNCESFPNCKFGDKCLYVHPACKFGSSCTKRECPYSHGAAVKPAASRLAVKAVTPQAQNCKYFPSCVNVSCPFYHPKPCKFGKYCKNQADCTFSHSFAVNKYSLTWRSK